MSRRVSRRRLSVLEDRLDPPPFLPAVLFVPDHVWERVWEVDWRDGDQIVMEWVRKNLPPGAERVKGSVVLLPEPRFCDRGEE